jgi:hypothetical protein
MQGNSDSSSSSPFTPQRDVPIYGSRGEAAFTSPPSSASSCFSGIKTPVREPSPKVPTFKVKSASPGARRSPVRSPLRTESAVFESSSSPADDRDRPAALARSRSEGSMFRPVDDSPSADIDNSPTPTSAFFALSVSRRIASTTQPFLSTRRTGGTKDDGTCWNVLPAVQRKYKLKGDWKDYVLLLVYGQHKRVLSYDERPRLITERLKEAGELFILFFHKHWNSAKISLTLFSAHRRTPIVRHPTH